MQLQPKPLGTFSRLLPVILQTVAGIVILLVIWVVISNLPMLARLPFPTAFTLRDLLSAIVLTIIAVMLGNFGLRMEQSMERLIKGFPQGGAMVKQLAVLLAVLFIYLAYRPIVTPYMDEVDWLYHLLFLFVFLTYLGVLGFAVYSNIESLAALLSGKKMSLSSSAETATCVSCGGEVSLRDETAPASEMQKLRAVVKSRYQVLCFLRQTCRRT